MRFTIYRISIGFLLWYGSIRLGMCVELQSPNEASQGSNEKMVSSMDEALNILEGIALPIPPTVRNSPADRVKTIMEERESVPKYVRLPDIDGIKVGFEKEFEILPSIMRTVKTLSLVPKVFEIEDFLDEDECDLLIELAKRKKLTEHNDKSVSNVIQDGPENTFHAWDLNDDGFVDNEEVVLIPGTTVRMSLDDADDMLFMLKMDQNKDGKIDLKEMINTDLLKLKNYVKDFKEMQTDKREMKKKSAWVWHDEDELLRFQNDYFYGYHSRFTSLTGLPEELIEESEPLQVQNFEKNQFSKCRKDSDEVNDLPCCLYGEVNDCRACRYITMEIFLNDVEDGGELVFPLANHPYSDITNCTGEWRGYFTYAMTTGSKSRFTMNLKIFKNGPNQLLSGDGRDSSGQFDIEDGLILGNMVKFIKQYNSSPSRNGDIYYSGKIISGSRITGNWWVPGKKRLFGTFFMWNKDYELLLKTSNAKCNHYDFCPKSGLVIKPKKGKAIFWYNHETDYQTGMVGIQDNDSVYGHCAVKKGSKWFATARINVIGDGEVDLRAWRRGFNWLQDIEKYPNVMKSIGSNTPRTKSEDYTDDFERFKFEEKIQENKTINRIDEKKAPSHVLNAVNLLLNTIDGNGLKTIAKVVHRKLRLTCVPYYAENDTK